MSFPLFCITNRHLYSMPFLDQLDRILTLRPAGVILREKDLSLEKYVSLGRQVLEKCRQAGVPCWFHTFVEAALELDPEGIQLPMPVLRALPHRWRQKFPGQVGASCHSLEEVLEAARLGADCCTFSHIYPTRCKPGLAPRGLEQLRQVCAQSPIPVYALGGITPEKVPELKEAGAAGAVMMGWWGTVASPTP